MLRQASVIVADDMSISVLGKFNLIGGYTADIIIPTDPSFVAQLIFLFSIETGVDEPFTRIQLEVALPTQQPSHLDVQVPGINQMVAERPYLLIRQPFVFQNAILRPGQIGAKVIHDNGEIELTALPLISLRAPVTAQG
jgi:hypothetical protein